MEDDRKIVAGPWQKIGNRNHHLVEVTGEGLLVKVSVRSRMVGTGSLILVPGQGGMKEGLRRRTDGKNQQQQQGHPALYEGCGFQGTRQQVGKGNKCNTVAHKNMSWRLPGEQST